MDNLLALQLLGIFSWIPWRVTSSSGPYTELTNAHSDLSSINTSSLPGRSVTYFGQMLKAVGK